MLVSCRPTSRGIPRCYSTPEKMMTPPCKTETAYPKVEFVGSYKHYERE